jgi:hypothetical protein
VSHGVALAPFSVLFIAAITNGQLVIDRSAPLSMLRVNLRNRSIYFYRQKIAQFWDTDEHGLPG